MSLSNNSIMTLFGLLNTHLYDNFSRFNLQHLTKFNQEFKSEYLSFLNKDSETQFTTFNLEALSSFLFKLFTTRDPYSIGDFAINIITHAKSNSITWFDKNLIDFCSSFTLTQQNQPLTQQNQPLTQQNHPQQQNQPQNSTTPNTNTSTIATNAVDSSTLSSLTESSSINDTITLSKSDLLNLLAEFNKGQAIQLDNFFSKSITREIREQHFSDLKSLTETLVQFSNSKSINEAHTKNDVFPKSLNRDRFPAPFYKNDPQFVFDFNKLILSFQEEIMKFILIHQTKTILETEDLIKSKIDFIEAYDNNIKTKYSVLKDEIIKLHSEPLKISFEKINKLISKKGSQTVSFSNNVSSNSSKKSKNNKKTKKSNNNSLNRTKNLTSSPSSSFSSKTKTFNNHPNNNVQNNKQNIHSRNQVCFQPISNSSFIRTSAPEKRDFVSTYVTPNTRQYRQNKSYSLSNSSNASSFQHMNSYRTHSFSQQQQNQFQYQQQQKNYNLRSAPFNNSIQQSSRVPTHFNGYQSN